jgi:hypothetical protein
MSLASLRPVSSSRSCRGSAVECGSWDTLVVGVHCGYVDTELTAHVDTAKLPPATVAEHTMQALLEDNEEVLVDDFTRHTRTALSGDISTMQRIIP